MKNALIALFVMAAVLITMSSFQQTSSSTEISYPDGYRNWKHVKTAIIGPNSPASKLFGGFHHIYANDKALEGFSTGIFPDGSVLVFDLLEAVEENSDYTEGNRKHIDVMVKDASRFAETGGWGFEEFKLDTRTPALTAPVRAQCVNCHAKQKDKDMVFSTMRN